MIVVALVTLLLLAANALFVAAEFAVVSAPKQAVEHKAKNGDRGAARLLATITSPVIQDRYIATAQLGITFASLGLGMYGEHALAEWLEPRLVMFDEYRFMTSHALASVVAVAALSYLHIFIGEMIPKGLALARAEATARAVDVPMRITLVALYPLVYVLNAVGNFCLRLVGVHRQTDTHASAYTPEELQIVVEESERGGAFSGESAKILQELFEFGDLTASQAMVPRVRVIGIAVGSTPSDLRRIIRESRRTRYPVYDGDLDHIVGMLHVKDLLRRLLSGESVTALDVRRLPFVPVTAPLDDVLATMQRHQAHMAIVIDEHGGTAGIINLEDLFEEVVGDIDEGAPSTPAMVTLADGSVRAAGTVRIDELGQHFDLDLEHEEVDSLSGLVLERLGRPPEVGDVVDYGRLRLEVTAISGRGVQEVRVQLAPAGDDE